MILYISKAGIHDILISSTTENLLGPRSGEYVKVSFITLFEISINSIFSMSFN